MSTFWDRISGNVGPWWYPYWGCMLADIRDEGGIRKGLRWWWASQVIGVWRYRAAIKRMQRCCPDCQRAAGVGA